MHAIRQIILLALFTACLPLATSALDLAREGGTRHVIVQAADATEAERFAARELAHFLWCMTGAAFRIVDEANLSPSVSTIHIGQTAFVQQQGIDTSKLGPETWVLRTVGDNLILTGGRPRGTLYAVYEFLETYAGCRWITHDLDIIPAHPALTLPDIDMQGEPGFAWRETTLYPRHDGGPDSGTHEAYALFLVRNRYNAGPRWLDEPRFGYAVKFGRPGSSHTFHRYQEDWDDVPPDYFAMQEDGTRASRSVNALGHDFCLTHSGVRDRIYGQLLAFIAADRAESAEHGSPAPRYYAISQNDTSSRYCRCPNCMAIAEREGSYSGVMIDFINDIASRIAETHPEIRLVTEAYQFTKRPPKFIRPRNNVIIRMALLDQEYRADELADVLRPMTAPTNLKARQITEGWAAVVPGRQLFTWDYAQFRLPFRHPYDATAKIMRNLEFWHNLGIRHAFIEQTGIDLSFRCMRDWVFLRKSLKPELDDNQLAAEFLSAYFGPAFEPMRRYYDLLVTETVAGEKPYFDTPPAVNPYLTPEFFTRVNSWLDEAEGLALRSVNMRYLRNVKYERVPVDSAILHLWHRYAHDPAWSGKKELILGRYAQNKRLLIASWATSVDAWVKSGRDAFANELTILRLEPPAQFVGRNAAMRLPGMPLPGMSRVTRVNDPEAAGGRATLLGQGKPEEHQLPLRSRIHDSATKEDWGMFTLEQVPRDEDYHWYHIGTAPLTAHCILWFNIYTVIPLSWAAVPPPSNEKEIWVSLKFTGPAYVAGSTNANRVSIDQVVAVPPEQEPGAQ